MTTKIEITDKMVERAAMMFKAHPQQVVCDAHRLRARQVLEAALNPPEEPEIPVSEAMKEAGRIAWHVRDDYGCNWASYNGPEFIYRAMEKARRKEEAERIPQWVTTKTEEISPGVTRITGYFK